MSTQVPGDAAASGFTLQKLVHELQTLQELDVGVLAWHTPSSPKDSLRNNFIFS